MITRQEVSPTPSALHIRSKLRAGVVWVPNNHGLRVRTKVRAGGIDPNHGLRVRTKVRAGLGGLI